MCQCDLESSPIDKIFKELDSLAVEKNDKPGQEGFFIPNLYCGLCGELVMFVSKLFAIDSWLSPHVVEELTGYKTKYQELMRELL